MRCRSESLNTTEEATGRRSTRSGPVRTCASTYLKPARACTRCISHNNANSEAINISWIVSEVEPVLVDPYKAIALCKSKNEPEPTLGISNSKVCAPVNTTAAHAVDKISQPPRVNGEFCTPNPPGQHGQQSLRKAEPHHFVPHLHRQPHFSFRHPLLRPDCVYSSPHTHRGPTRLLLYRRSFLATRLPTSTCFSYLLPS